MMSDMVGSSGKINSARLDLGQNRIMLLPKIKFKVFADDWKILRTVCKLIDTLLFQCEHQPVIDRVVLGNNLKPGPTWDDPGGSTGKDELFWHADYAPRIEWGDEGSTRFFASIWACLSETPICRGITSLRLTHRIDECIRLCDRGFHLLDEGGNVRTQEVRLGFKRCDRLCI
jgi:hypothetical protein